MSVAIKALAFVKYATCSDCGAEVVWMRSVGGGLILMNSLNPKDKSHWVSCPYIQPRSTR